VKAVGKQSNRLAEMSGNKKEMENNKSVTAASPIGHSKPPVPIDSHTEPSESIGDKNRITDLILKMEVTCSCETSLNFNGLHGLYPTR
jgi:hypothetical protein